MTCTCPSHWLCQLTATPAWPRNQRDLRISRKPRYSSRDFSPSCLIIRNCWTGKVALRQFSAILPVLYDNPGCPIVSCKVSFRRSMQQKIYRVFASISLNLDVIWKFRLILQLLRLFLYNYHLWYEIHSSFYTTPILGRSLILKSANSPMIEGETCRPRRRLDRGQKEAALKSI